MVDSYYSGNEFTKVDVVKYLAEHLTDKQKEKKKIPKYYKPKLRHEILSQFPWRCPICFQKFFIKEQAEECLDKCWDEIPEKVWAEIERIKIAPKEIGSWQWDLDDKHQDYCGVVFYDNGDISYALKKNNFLKYTTLEKLLEIMMEKAETLILFQKSKQELPEPLRKFKDCSKFKSKKSDKMPFHLIKNELEEIYKKR